MSADGSAHANPGAFPGLQGGLLGLPPWLWIFLLAAAVRTLLLALWAPQHPDFYRLGGEIGRVAMSLLHSGQFADPYMIPTGPTAHPAPLSPALLALIYHAFGMGAAAGYVRALLGIVSSSVLCASMPWLACRLGLGAGAGVIAGVFCAAVPMHGTDEFLGPGSIAHSSLAFALLTVAFVNRWKVQRTAVPGSLLLGVGCGAAFHILPPLLLVVAGYLIFELWRNRERRWVLMVACIALGALLACVPWTWRNCHALQDLFFIRSNLGLELRIANHPGAHADIDVTLARQGTLRHPSENLDEARLVRDLGEAEYNRRARLEALAWIRDNPREFLLLSGLRFLHFWCGPFRFPLTAFFSTLLTVLALLGLRRILPLLDAPARAALLVPFAAFPLVYYVVSYVAHYPAPLAWLQLLLAAFEVRARMPGSLQVPARGPSVLN